MKKKHGNQPQFVSVTDKNGDILMERAYLRTASVSQDQREARTRREALAAILLEDKERRDALAFGTTPTVQEDLQEVRRRPIGAPMATRESAFRSWWNKWEFSLALAAWSGACFLLGRLV